MIKGFDNIGVAVTDLDRALAFYKAIGFEETYREGSSASVKAGDAVLYVFQTTSGDGPRPRDVSLMANPPGIDHISVRVDDVDAADEEVRARGVAVESGPEDQSWGSRTITMLDPDGNRIWFLGPLKGS